MNAHPLRIFYNCIDNKFSQISLDSGRTHAPLVKGQAELTYPENSNPFGYEVTVVAINV